MWVQAPMYWEGASLLANRFEWFAAALGAVRCPFASVAKSGKPKIDILPNYWVLDSLSNTDPHQQQLFNELHTGIATCR